MNVDSYENKPKLPIIERISKKKILFLNSVIINQTYVIIPQAWVILLDFLLVPKDFYIICLSNYLIMIVLDEGHS
jgi:hypothetical protein